MSKPDAHNRTFNRIHEKHVACIEHQKHKPLYKLC